MEAAMLFSSQKNRGRATHRLAGHRLAASILIIRIIEITPTGCELA